MPVNLFTEPSERIIAPPPVFFDFEDATGETRIDETRATCNCQKNTTGSHEIHSAITHSRHYFTPFASVSKSDAVNSITCVPLAKCFRCAAHCGRIPVVSDQTRLGGSFVRQPIDQSGRHILAVARVSRVWVAAGSQNAVLCQDAGWDVTRGLAIGESGTGFRQLRLAYQSTQLDRALDYLITATSHKSETTP